MASTSKDSQVARSADKTVLVRRDVVGKKGEIHSVTTPAMDSDVSDQRFSYNGNQWGRGSGCKTLTAIRPKQGEKDQFGFLVTNQNICYAFAAGVPCAHLGKCNNYHAKLGSIMSDMPRRKPVVIAKIPSLLRDQARFSSVLEFHSSHKRKLSQLQKEESERRAKDEEDSSSSDEDPAAAFERAEAIAAKRRAAKRAKHSHPAEPSHSAEPAPEVEAAPPAPASTGTAGEGVPEEEEIVTA